MAENRFAKYLTPPDVGPTYEALQQTEDPIVKAAPAVDPFKAAAEQRAQEDQRFQREKFDWERQQAAAKADKESGGGAYSESAMDAFDRAIGSADRLLKHPGIGAAVGSAFDPQSFGSINPFTGKAFGGTNAANFNAELDAMRAQVFLPMVQSMKGLGALSNAEGQKLTDAIGALDPNMSEDAFKESLNRVIADLTTYRNRGMAPQIKSGRTGKAYTFDVPDGADDAAILAAAKAALRQNEPDTTEAPVMGKRLKYNPATGELE